MTKTFLEKQIHVTFLGPRISSFKFHNNFTDSKVRSSSSSSSSDVTQRLGTVASRFEVSHFVCVVCAVEVGGQPGGHGLLGEGRWAGHPEPDGGPERREGGGAGLEGELFLISCEDEANKIWRIAG